MLLCFSNFVLLFFITVSECDTGADPDCHTHNLKQTHSGRTHRLMTSYLFSETKTAVSILLGIKSV